MKMKALGTLIPIWSANIPPSTENENDYLLKIGGIGEDAEEVHSFIVVQWCTDKKKYFVEPVEVLENGQLKKSEAHFDTQGLLRFRVQMAQLGIRLDRHMIDVSIKRKDYQQQLADIHPAFVQKRS